MKMVVPMQIRQLVPGDEEVLESFLVAHRDSSMFLRSNVRRAGVAYRGQQFEATYTAAFRQNEIVGVIAHSWLGMLLIQAPEHLAELTRACVEHSQRAVTALSGPRDQTREALAVLGLDLAQARFHGEEQLYALSLDELVVPSALASGAIAARPPHPSERDLLCAWRLAYDIELLGAEDTPEARQRSAEFLDAQIADENVWIAVDQGVPVSLSAFNATLPDVVQLGGIYTPPQLRGRGFAKVAVAASLLVGRQRGATRGVLFTGNPNAVRTYEAIGFRRVGDYALILFQ
jgi:GNAT superfamily N-acetyltransferase